MNEKSPLTFPQDAVMADYKGTTAFRKNAQAEEALHLFFSPNRVPVGLSDNQVAICVRLYPYRMKMLKRYNELADAKLALKLKEFELPAMPQPTLSDALELVAAGVHDDVKEAMEHLEHLWNMAERLRKHPLRIVTLPNDLGPSQVMTPERFRRGIRAFIAQYRLICGR